MPTMSLRDEAPEGAPSPCERMVRRNQRQKPLYTTLPIVVSANRRSFIKEHFDADSNTSRTPERRRAYWAPVALVVGAAYSRRRIGVRSLPAI